MIGGGGGAAMAQEGTGGKTRGAEGALHAFGAGFGEGAAFAFAEGDVGGARLAFEAGAGVDEAVAEAVDVGVIDLGGVADEDEFGAAGHAGDDGFGFEGGELLGFVEDEEAVGDGAAADVAEGFDFEEALFDEGVVGFGGGVEVEGGRVFFVLFAAGTGLGRAEGSHDDVEGVVDGLEPGAEFFVEGAGEEAEGFAHGDDGAADGEAVVAALEDFAEAGGDGEEGFAGTGLAVAGDEGEGGVEEGVEEALLAEIEGADGLAFGDFDGIWHVEADEAALAGVAGGHGLFFADLEEDVFVGGEVGGFAGGKGDCAAAGEALQFQGVDGEALEVVAGDVAGFGFVVEVVFAGDADGAGFELEVEVFGDEDDGGAVLFAHHEGAGEDAVIDFVDGGEERAEGAEGGEVGGRVFGAESDDAEAAAAEGRDAAGDAFAAFLEEGGEFAVDGAGAGTAVVLFVFEAVEFAEDVDGDAEVVVGEAVDAAGVVDEDVGVEDEGFGVLVGGDQALAMPVGEGGGRGFGGGGAAGAGGGGIGSGHGVGAAKRGGKAREPAARRRGGGEWRTGAVRTLPRRPWGGGWSFKTEETNGAGREAQHLFQGGRGGGERWEALICGCGGGGEGGESGLVMRRAWHFFLYPLLPAGALLWVVGAAMIYQGRWDGVAGLTVFPFWVWGAVGLGMAGVSWFGSRRRGALGVAGGCVAAVLGFSDETRPLLRGAAAQPERGRAAAAPDGRPVRRVITFNCLAGAFNPAAPREVMGWEPDVVLFQESASLGVLQQVARELYGAAPGVHAAGTWECGIIARGRLLRSAAAANPSRLSATIQFSDGQVLEVTSVHLSSAETEVRIYRGETLAKHAANRRQRRGEVERLLAGRPGAAGARPSLIGGDFNAGAGDAIFRLLEEAGYQDAWAAVGSGWPNTFPNEAPLLRIDYQWSAADLVPLRGRVVASEHSDHRMVICDYGIP